MPILNSPFAPSANANSSGRGEVVLTVLPPAIPSLSTVSYSYPLKLLSRTPEGELKSRYPTTATPPLHLYLLTYGGGLLPGDHIDVSVTVKPRGRLVVTTPQGSTKIYKTEAQGGRKRPIPKTDNDRSKQTLKVQLGRESGLCLLPDPSAPFADSRYDQFQTFTLLHGDHSKAAGSSQGDEAAQKQRDASDPDRSAGSHMPSTQSQTSVRSRAHPHGVLGTLIIHGPLFESLADFFMEAFTSQPRIGGQNWSSSSTYYPSHTNEHVNNNEKYDNHDDTTEPAEMRHRNVTWTAARVRNGFVLVKFGAPDFENARDWLGHMLRAEGSIQREFGEEALGSM
ncbi:urease accessory protein UreD [Trichophyton equinum CBS 127.97]|uniref:Urease accessory protein UreD n=1 Tax=Trichophyton equinum (strain ATCC MYA-4606 / CBS 127.97) TaxID=559882 RepID=F2PV66_TRIEC|nr:urease accessory protein UreD [Trichophyton equinum CBS 127.97]